MPERKEISLTNGVLVKCPHLSNFASLLEDLVEDFKSCLPENIVVHLNEKKVVTLSDAAVITDEFVLTHKSFSFCPPG